VACGKLSTSISTQISTTHLLHHLATLADQTEVSFFDLQVLQVLQVLQGVVKVIT
jgi:hypothetical protein